MKRKIASISILVPVFNENETLGKIYQKLKKLQLGVKKEIIIVDDASTDGSREFLKQEQKKKPQNIKILFQGYNQGKGAAVRRALRHAKGDYIIVQDADLEYDPRSIVDLLSHAKHQDAPVVYGSRNLKKGNKYSYWHLYYGGKALSLLGNVLYGQSITDITTCYMLIRSDVFKKIKILENGFGLEVEVTAKVSKLGIKIKEIPIPYYPRNYKQGKKLRIRDGIRAIFLLFKFRYTEIR